MNRYKRKGRTGSDVASKKSKITYRGHCSWHGVLWSIAVYRLVFRIHIEESKEREREIKKVGEDRCFSVRPCPRGVSQTTVKEIQ